MADFTVDQFINKHGKVIADAVLEMDGGADIYDMCISGAFEIYGFDEDDADALTNGQREMVAVQALVDLLGTQACKDSVDGAISRVEIGSDSTPAVSFYDRQKVTQAYESKLQQTLSHLQRLNGYMPYLTPTLSDQPVTSTFIDFIPETTSDSEV